MPTTGRLVGALCFAALGLYLGYLAQPYFEEGRIPSYWWPLCGLAGVWTGWVVVGKRVGLGFSSSIGNGLTGLAAMVFWILFIMSFTDMIKKSFRRSYDDPLEALVNVFQIGIEHAVRLGQSDVIVAGLVGGVIAGIVTEVFGRRFS